MSTHTDIDIDPALVDAVRRNAAQVHVAERPVEQVRARADQRRRHQRARSAFGAAALVVAGGAATAVTIGRDQPMQTMAPTAIDASPTGVRVTGPDGSVWRRYRIPHGSAEGAAMLVTDGTGPFYGVEYVSEDSTDLRVSASVDGVAWRPLVTAPVLKGDTISSTGGTLTAVGTRVALVGRLAVDYDGLTAGSLVLTTSDDAGETWSTTGLRFTPADIRPLGAAIVPDGVLVALSGNATPARSEGEPDDATQQILLQHIARSGAVTPVDTADLPGVESWQQIEVDESVDGIVLGGGGYTSSQEWMGTVYAQRFADDDAAWSDLGPALSAPLEALQLEGDMVLAVSRGRPLGTTSLIAQVTDPWSGGGWQRTDLDELLPDDIRQVSALSIAVNTRTVAVGPAGVVIAAMLTSRDEGDSASIATSVPTTPVFHSVDGTTWTILPIDVLAGGHPFFVRPLLRSDGATILTTMVADSPPADLDPRIDDVPRRPAWSATVLVGPLAG